MANSSDVTAATLQKWDRQLQLRGGFLPNMRGITSHTFIPEKDNVSLELTSWLRRNKEVNVTAISSAINRVMLKVLIHKKGDPISILKNYDWTIPISRDTAHQWARNCGVKFEEHKSS